MRNRLARGVAVMVLGCAATLAAQAPATVDASRVHDLVVLIEAADQSAALEAAKELQQIGPSVAPALIETLKTHPGCQAQWVASGVLAGLKLEAALVESTLLRIARGTCRPASMADVRLQQEAAYTVIDRARGISLMAELLRGDEQLARYRAAFAFDALTERLRPDHDHTIAATPEIVAATEAALPLLRDAALSKAHLQFRCLCREALDQARRLPIEALRTRATKLLAGVAIDCDTSRSGTAAASAAVPAPTAKMSAQAMEQLIARLDTQPAGLASQTASTLLAAGDEVEPLLQKRLRQTDKCRGLALVAGVLASRNAAEADVDAAFTRVLEGRCDGREPFDVMLAQSVAAAFMVRPDGITKMTRLLVDRDVSVRRRAAEAFSTLFERLGSGEQRQPAPPVDPALLPPARAALEPLVALVTTERDQQARCLAVRALMHAQQAVDDALRAAAAATTAGRTLRCLAPPNP